jgi:hypothetical protein
VVFYFAYLIEKTGFPVAEDDKYMQDFNPETMAGKSTLHSIL